MPGARPTVTVVVPVGPGDALAPGLRLQLAAFRRGDQVRVVCTHRADASAAATTGDSGPLWEILLAQPGRATQQNAGAQGARGDWLWFLHADCVLAADTVPALERFIDRNRPALGYFDLRFLGDGPALMRVNECGAWLRSHWLGLPFGDQGLLLPRAVFERLGGFDTTIDHGEDHELVWRARRAGVPLHAVGAPLYTSARKYAQRGWWTTTCRHLHETWQQARRFSRVGKPR